MDKIKKDKVMPPPIGAFINVMKKKNVEYKVMMREDENGRVEVERVYKGREVGVNRVAWKPVDKRKFTSDVLNTVESFVAR